MRTDGPIYASGTVRNGRLKLHQSNRLSGELSDLRDGPVEIEIKRKPATRNISQNSLYWVGVVAPLAEHTGYSSDEMHEILKAKFLPKHVAVSDKNGEIVGEFVIGGSTTKLTKADFSRYLDDIAVWAGSLGVTVLGHR